MSDDDLGADLVLPLRHPGAGEEAAPGPKPAARGRGARGRRGRGGRGGARRGRAAGAAAGAGHDDAEGDDGAAAAVPAAVPAASQDSDDGGGVLLPLHNRPPEPERALPPVPAPPAAAEAQVVIDLTADDSDAAPVGPPAQPPAAQRNHAEAKKKRSKKRAREPDPDYGDYGGFDSGSDEDGDEQPQWKRSVTCYRCQEAGHYANECPNGRNGGAASSASSYGGRRGACFKCGKEGHWASECNENARASSSAAGDIGDEYDEYDELGFADHYPPKPPPQVHQPPQQQPAAPAASMEPVAVQLSATQQAVLNLALQKKNIIISGCAGTGKSLLLQRIIAQLPASGRHVCATTGVAALQLRGTTLHSWAGVGLATASAEKLFFQIGGKAKERWTKTNVLIVDECSMLSAALFDKLEELARRIRRDTRPFGGIHLIFSGDLLQLPPVAGAGTTAKDAEFFFEATSFKRVFPPGSLVELTEVFRQGDKDFVRALNSVRHGEVPDWVLGILRPCFDRQLQNAAMLRPRRAQVEDINASRLTALQGEKRTFVAVDTGNEPFKRMLNQGVVPQELTVKVGAQVMLLRNLSSELVNGSIGRVVGFDRPDKDWMEQARNLGHHVTELDREGMFPVVQFQGAGGRSMVIAPVQCNIEVDGRVEASRFQVPLLLAWAVTIHKCQGSTLDLVHVDLAGVFESGQAYVALSRARSLSGLSISGFSANVVRADRRALEFYETYQASKPT